MKTYELCYRLFDSKGEPIKGRRQREVSCDWFTQHRQATQPPNSPTITRISINRRTDNVVLRVDGDDLIANNTVIEINRVTLDEISYPESFRENGGSTTRVVSRDSRLAELVKPGQPVEITVFNPLTNRRSTAFTFAR